MYLNKIQDLFERSESDMNKLSLESVMKKYGDTQESLAEYLGMTRTSFNKKINERDGASFTQPEIKAIKDKYELSADELNKIFFTEKVSK